MRDDQEALLARFAALLAHSRSQDTKRLYVAAVRRWLQFGGHGGHVDAELLTSYLYARRQAVSDAAVNIDIKALRAFYGIQSDLGESTRSEATKIPRQVKPQARLPKVLDAEAVALTLARIPLDTFSGLRDFTIIRLILETGLRAGECARMETSDLLTDGSIYVHGKGGRDRYVTVTEELAGTLQGYLHARAQRRAGNCPALWLTTLGKPMRDRRSIWDVVSKRIWAGIHARCGVMDLQRASVGRAWRGHYPHELRATFATRLIERGMPITAIAQLMGHADIAVTARYLGIGIEHLRQAMALHPRATRA